MKAQSTYDTILDLAEELVQTRGYNAFSYRDLATPLGIKPASVHYHFPTKGDLGQAMVARYRGTFRAALQVIEREEELALSRLGRYADLFLMTFRNGNRLCLCGSLATDIDTLTSPVREEVQVFWREQITWLTAVLTSYKEQEPECRLTDAEATAEVILSALEGAMMSARVMDSITPLEHTKVWIMQTVSG